MEEKLGNLNDFVVIKTRFSGSDEDQETSLLSGIKDYFETHLENSFNDPSNLKKYGIDVYKIKVGNVIKISPSVWTREFCEKQNLPLDNKYDFEYKITNISIEYYSKNPTNDSELPLIEISIELKRN